MLALFHLFGLDLGEDAVALLSFAALAVLVDRLVRHDLVELFVAQLLAALLRNLLLELVNVLHVLALFSVFRAHLEVLQGLVQLFVFLFGLLLLEHLDAGLLLQKTFLDVQHVLIGFEHFCKEVVGSRDRHLRLQQEFHALNHVLSGRVVERHLAFDVVLHCELLWHLNWVLAG